MKIAFVSSEVFPYAKTGGLADVAGSLPAALKKLGHDVKIFIPKYDLIDETKYGLNYISQMGKIPVRINAVEHIVHLHQAKLPNSEVEVNFIDCPYYFFRQKIYTNDKDEDERFILFSKAAIEIMQRQQWIPDVIHCNDWQTGLIPLFIKDNYSWDKAFNKTSTLFTIHNIGYQGKFFKSTLFSAEINGDLFYPGGPIEYFDDISFMKAAISFADIINTVSKTYAEEILTPEYGAGMENVLKQRKDDLYGIINGVDYSIWNPDIDKLIPFRYNSSYLTGKEKNKKFLLDHLNLPYNKDIPVIGIISRLVSQKGFDIVAEGLDDLLNINAQWVILGSGEDKYEKLFVDLASSNPQKFSVYLGYNNELSHLIEAGSDIFLMPSHYEPCGLNQIYSLKYGTVPIVRKTGGLADTVQDWHELNPKGSYSGTGFSFSEYSPFALFSALKKAVSVFNEKTIWKKIQKNGMEKDYSWKVSAEEYIKLYSKAIEKRK